MTEALPTFSDLDYIANELYQADSAKRGRPAGVRWWCLHRNLRERWRVEARRRVLQWSESEQSAMESVCAEAGA